MLQRYLAEDRVGLLGRLDGLSERDVRRPLTPTGTTLLGLVEHEAGVQQSRPVAGAAGPS